MTRLLYPLPPQIASAQGNKTLSGQHCKMQLARLAFTVLKQKKSRQYTCHDSFGGSWWIRTTEAESSRFTVCPHWPLGKAPIFSLWPPCLPATYVIIAEGFSKCKPFFDFFCDFLKKARFHHSIEQKLFLTYSCSKRTFIIVV